MAAAAGHKNMSYMYRFNMGLRGFHVYKAILDPYVDEEISFEAENDNAYDDFAIAGYAGVTKVGHVPRELSRYFHFAIQQGAIISSKVISAQHRPSPLLQGGLEIPLEVTIRMDEERNIEIFRSRVREVKYRLDTPYIDKSKTILNQILPSKFHADADIDIDDNDEINIDVDDEFLAMDVNPEDDVDGFDGIQDVLTFMTMMLTMMMMMMMMMMRMMRMTLTMMTMTMVMMTMKISRIWRISKMVKYPIYQIYPMPRKLFVRKETDG